LHEDDPEYTGEKYIQSAKQRHKKHPQFIQPNSSDMWTFGDEQGDTIGCVCDYMLRKGGSTKSFSWSFYKYDR
jgi:hypothetical protein